MPDSLVLDDSSPVRWTLGELVGRASTLTLEGRADEARRRYLAWIDAHPAHPQLFVALFNAAALAGEAGDGPSAVAQLRRAVALNPDFMPAYINLGVQLERAGDPAGAIELWRNAANRAVPINASNLGYAMTAARQIARVLAEGQQHEAAEDVVRLCLDLDPTQRDMAEQHVALRQSQCKWPVLVGRERMSRAAMLKAMHPLSFAAYSDDPLLHLALADHHARAAVPEGPHDPALDRRDAPTDTRGRRMRVGYVSSDLRDHAIGCLMAEFFELHHRDTIEVFAYYSGPASNSEQHARIKAAVEHWTDIRALSDDEAARRVAADRIDILVDINGHTRDSRTGLFARRPAPIQVNWLGYPGTMGTPYHHYIVADEWIIPPESEIHYSEKVVRLPCYQPNDRKRRAAPDRPTRAQAGLPQDAFVFCCFNGTHKIGRFTFERWMEILARVPDGVLWLLDAPAATRARLGAFAQAHGVAASRLVFAPRQGHAQHLARYPLADLFLDTTPYGAHTTASDALWMGVPVLTLSGRGFASRVCGSLVRSAGLADLVVGHHRDYVERAVALGHDRAAIAAYKAKLESGRATCALFDTALLVDRLEALYRAMCADHQKGKTPMPDLRNLDRYLDAGIEHDHEGQEMQAVADYHAHYRERLARLDRARPIASDDRLWKRDTPARAPAVVKPVRRRAVAR